MISYAPILNSGAGASCLALLAIVLWSHPCAAEDRARLVDTSFEQDPVRSGWRLLAGDDETAAGKWINTLSSTGEHALEVRLGWWESPAFQVEPFQYYRVRFQSTVEGTGFWVVTFYDRHGNPLAANHREGIYPADQWMPHEFCFRGRLKGVAARIRFQAIEQPLYVDDVVVQRMTRQEVAEWADALAATLPPLDLKPISRPGPPLARTMEKLAAGERVRIVLLGDSIMNDTGNSPFDVLVERHYPKARIEVVNSVRGGTGCRYYQHMNRLQEYVVDYEPDLLVIGGISHGFDAEAVRSVIRQVRQSIDPDILLLSGAVCPIPLVQENFLKYTKIPQEEAEQRFAGYGPALPKIAREEDVGYFDIRSVWDRAVPAARKHPMWFHRDPIHANARGKQVLARIMEQYFAPE